MDGHDRGVESEKGGGTMTTSERYRARPATPTLAEFNDAERDVAAEVLRACLDIPEWVAQVEAGRPFDGLDALHKAGAAASSSMGWEQVAGALDRHPRIGEEKAAASGTATESAWSATEQGGVQDSHADALAEGNRAYERKFGQIFLICAAGLSGDQILANLHARLTNDQATERQVVMGELKQIATLRLAKAVAP
jgi:2-oxo-4-hydroxy-4-carboxy-5-ureidoimidazoline decarboxylase